MKGWRRRIGILLICIALIVMQLPVGMAEAADSAGFVTDGSTLVSYQGTAKTVNVPSDVTVIGSSAFEDNVTMEKVVFPKALRRIKPYAFWGCDALKEIQFGTGLKEIGDYAFTSCQGLVSLSLPANITSIGIRTFADCVNLETIQIPETVSFIHETAFDGCKNLVIQCPEGSYADKYARDFYRRQALMEEYEAADLRDDAARETEAEEKDSQGQETGQVDDFGVLGSTSVVGNHAVLLVDSRVPTVYQGQISAADERIDYPVKYRIVNGSIIADQAYYKDDTISQIILPDTIREIGEFAFARSAAQSLYVPEGVEKISYGAFYHCDDLRYVELPETIRKVEPQSFQHTAWLQAFLEDGTGGEGDFLISGGVLAGYRGSKTDVVIPEGVRVIAAQCFRQHSEIESVAFPESLTDVGEGAFEGCSGLKAVHFQNGLYSIADRAFLDCPLPEVTLPGTLKELGIGAFSNATTIKLSGKTPLKTHESSAERLANESYRFAEADETEGLLQGGSLLVLGMSGARASLSNAGRPYTLTLEETRSGEAIQRAREAIRVNIGGKAAGDLSVIRLTLTDDSGIPITRLGRERLTLAIPIPDSMKGQELFAFQYDRNGQLEPMAIRYVSADGQTALILDTDQVFDICLQATGQTLTDDRIEETEQLLENAAVSPREGKSEQGTQQGAANVTVGMAIKWSAGALLLLAGFFLALTKVR